MNLLCRLGLHKWSKWVRTGKFVKERACYRCGVFKDDLFFAKDELWTDLIIDSIYCFLSIWTGEKNSVERSDLAKEIRWAEGKRKIELIIQEARR